MLFDALKDSALILPFLFAVYVLIELIENKYNFGIKIKRVLKGKFAPVLGAGVGIIPQCGFSVMATDLYLSKNVSLGTLVAIYIATSDEAIPILLTDYKSAINLLPILAIKLIFAILMGYFTDFMTKKYQIREYKKYMEIHNKSFLDNKIPENFGRNKGCCDHVLAMEKNDRIKNSEWAKEYILNPLIHSFKIFLFIFLVNFIFGYMLIAIGENRIMGFLSRMSWYQPIFSGLIGLIPNCASSVIITQLYVLGGMSGGALITGLCVNSGIATAVLIRKSENKAKSLLLILYIYLASVVLGFILTLLNLF